MRGEPGASASWEGGGVGDGGGGDCGEGSGDCEVADEDVELPAEKLADAGLFAEERARRTC